MRVAVWSVNFLAPGAQSIVALLRRLGYRAALRVIANAVRLRPHRPDWSKPTGGLEPPTPSLRVMCSTS